MKHIFITIIAATLLFLVIQTRAESPYQVDEIRNDLSFPWSLAFLPDGDFLITEKTGALIRLSADGANKVSINNVPEVLVAGQGGLQDIVLDRDFSSNQTLYISYAIGDGSDNYLRVISAKLVEDSLEEIKIILTTEPGKPTTHHYGARMAQMADGTLLILHGDAFQFRDKAQSLDNHFGKILRIKTNGEIPEDNPFLTTEGALPEIYSYGHRNQQAILITDEGLIWSHEHGPKGGDELNLIEPGVNYGWPAITHGTDYSGALISPFQATDSMAAPKAYWTPSIAPAGMAHYTGERFAEWKGDLFIANLKERSIRRIDLQDNEVKGQELLLTDRDERMRDIRMAADGLLYILTDGNPGKLLRLSPTD